MTAIGVTGHQGIPVEALDYVTQGIRDFLAKQTAPIVGYSCLAMGADQIFAQAVLDAGGELVAIIPCSGYESNYTGEDLQAYERLLAQATVTVLDFPEGSEDAYLAAGEEVMRNSDVIVAIWDGKPAQGKGGTADAVAYAKSLGKEVVVIWPAGVSR